MMGKYKIISFRCDIFCQLEGRFKCGDSGCTEIPLPKLSLEYKNITTTNNILLKI